MLASHWSIFFIIILAILNDIEGGQFRDELCCEGAWVPDYQEHVDVGDKKTSLTIRVLFLFLIASICLAHVKQNKGYVQCTWGSGILPVGKKELFQRSSRAQGGEGWGGQGEGEGKGSNGRGRGREAGAVICCDQCQEYFPSKSAAKNHRRKYCNKVVEVISLCDICCSEHC